MPKRARKKTTDLGVLLSKIKDELRVQASEQDMVKIRRLCSVILLMEQELVDVYGHVRSASVRVPRMLKGEG